MESWRLLYNECEVCGHEFYGEGYDDDPGYSVRGNQSIVTAYQCPECGMIEVWWLGPGYTPQARHQAK